ncbi:hypothetical protein BD560DRAFT_101391 [Blakeslea trispora]|nr:hypothetical protein BD560DRAFT_101391 [Blakeslea trispora]
MRSPLEESAIAKQVSVETALPSSPDGYSSIEKVNVIEEEDASRNGSHDVSRRRIFEMKGLIKSSLLADDDLTRESLMDKRADLAEHEINLPFIILANDLPRCAGYARFDRKLCYMSTASLKAFQMNAESLYSLYCNHDQQASLNMMAHYSNTQLMSTITRTLCLIPFFDMASIQAACKRKKLTIAHNIAILPVLQHVRLLGTKTNKPKETTASLRKQPYTSNLSKSTWQQILLLTKKKQKCSQK